MQIAWLFLLAIPVACISWTLTHEEIFKELRDYCGGRCKSGRSLLERKFFYLFTCEYCFSHYVSILFLFLTSYKLLMTDWRGYVIAGFSLVWIANVYMSIFNFLRQDIKKEKTTIEKMEKILHKEWNRLSFVEEGILENKLVWLLTTRYHFPGEKLTGIDKGCHLKN